MIPDQLDTCFSSIWFACSDCSYLQRRILAAFVPDMIKREICKKTKPEKEQQSIQYRPASKKLKYRLEAGFLIFLGA